MLTRSRFQQQRPQQRVVAPPVLPQLPQQRAAVPTDRGQRVNAQRNVPTQRQTVNSQTNVIDEVKQDSLLGNDRTYAAVIPGDNSERKPRILQTLEGTPRKGTVVVAVRGSADLEDIAVDVAAFSSKAPPNLSQNAFYLKIRNHVLGILNRDFVPSGSGESYKSYWDVFATGHSLGGAVTDQLIMDGVATGGMSFAAPRTRDSIVARPSYGTINHNDRIIGWGTAEVYDSRYDLMNSRSYDAQNHGLATQGDIQARDGGPIYNGQYFNASKDATMTYNRESRNYPGAYDGAGAAPKANVLRRLAANAYGPSKGVYAQTPRMFAEEGLELPSYRAYKSVGNAIYIQFYIISTPLDFLKFYEMPVYRVIKNQQRALADMDVDAYARARRDLPRIYI